MAEPRLFEDDITLDSDTPEGLMTSGVSTYQSHRHLFPGLAVGVVVLAVWLMFGPSPNTRGSVTLAGKDVAQLRPGAKVMLDGTPVGNVEQVEMRNGLPAARLQIDPKVLDKIPGSSRFEVGSLNRVIPGNIGVRIVSDDLLVDKAASAADLQMLRERMADQSILPTRTPLGFYLVLFVILAIGILLLGLVIKVLKSASFWTAVFVALLIVVLHVWYTGKLDDAARWGQEHYKTSRTSIEAIP